jgi:hypothetical protein
MPAPRWSFPNNSYEVWNHKELMTIICCGATIGIILPSS